jgi:tetratricopeptide (TPR) repeat protein
MKWLTGISAKTLCFSTAICGLSIIFFATTSSAQAKRPAEKVSEWRGPASNAANVPAVVASPKPATATLAPEAELRARIAKNEKDLQARIQLAEILKRKNDFDGMHAILRPASDNLPRKGMLLLAEAYRGKKDFLNEVRVLELLLAQNPKDYYVQNAVGEAYISVNRPDDAVVKFQESRKQNGRFLPAYKNLQAFYEKNNEKYEARNLLTDMIRIFGPRAEFYNELCRLYSMDGYLEKSAETCKVAISKQPRHAPNHMYYAQTLWDQEKKDSAIRVLKQAARTFPQSEDVQFAAGEMTYNVGDFINGFKFFSQCVKVHPKSSKCQLGYAKSGFELQKFDESLSGFSALCTLDNSSLGEFRKAVSSLRRKNELIWANKFDQGLNRCLAAN